MANSKTAALLLPQDDDVTVVPPASAGLDALADCSEDPAAQAARAEALEQLAMSHAMCDQAADACFYLCRSLGLARQQQTPDAAPDLELLFQLLGALADLPSEVSALPLPEGEADGLGVAELCHQLSAARDLTTAAWHEATESDASIAACPAAPAHALH
ncbi:hypothetical protein FUT87_09010 [Mitsuaria sp. TWR114]|uniref:hypothetical protein n=1 Tax=unclassified Roseateles TaxID=2626991 RepID=UPI000B830257|nr:MULTISPECIES: hypothetical protein [unclassified Roseateles]TXD92311.1 hypothetical protein FUT87_09010 [Mitsuaria sp. TWR114]